MAQYHSGIYSKQSESKQRLMDMGIPLEVLVETATAIAQNRGNSDEFCPVQAPGQMGWIGGVRSFRFGMFNVGFTLSNHKGFSSVISPDGKYEFFIMSGTCGVGRIQKGKSPRSKGPRGIQTARRIEENQLSFPLEELLVVENTQDLLDESFLGREHWCFVYQITKKAIFAEFSRPMTINDKGYVTEWSERIILDPIPIASETITAGQEENMPPANVSVTLKNGEENSGVQSETINTSEGKTGVN